MTGLTPLLPKKLVGYFYPKRSHYFILVIECKFKEYEIKNDKSLYDPCLECCSDNDWVQKRNRSECRNLVPVSSESQKILRQIKAFKTDLKSSLKDGEDMTVDSAIWYMTATLNESFARIDSTKKNLFEDSSFVIIPITNMKTITEEHLNKAYNEMVEDLRVYLFHITAVFIHLDYNFTHTI